MIHRRQIHLGITLWKETADVDDHISAVFFGSAVENDVRRCCKKPRQSHKEEWIMSLIGVNDLSFTYEGSYEPVFEHVSFQIDTDWKLGFTGRNGRGKTTFLRLLQGFYEYQGTISASVDFDYFPFEVEDKKADTLEIILGRMPDVEFWQLKRELSKLQVKEEVLYRPFETLSFGEQTKVLLAALFLRENCFLLIDEPTNHLDREGRRLLGEYLSQKQGFLLVSHDRAFLDSCVDHMLSINRSDILVQKGNFSVWYENKQRQDAFEQSEHDRLKKDIGRLEGAIKKTRTWGDKVEGTKIGGIADRLHSNVGSRAYLGEKSRKMQKRRKNLEKRQERAVEEKKGLLRNVETVQSLRLEPLTYHKEVLVNARELTIFYGDRKVCGPVDFEIRRGDRISLQGRNGCGKSSVIKAILARAGEKEGGDETMLSGAGGKRGRAEQEKLVRTEGKETQENRRNPVRAEGILETGSGLIISYISQDTSYLSGTLDEYAKGYGVDQTLFKALLRKLDFSREQFEKPIEVFSEGQKKKVLIARSLCQKAHLYIWDEPLNYIDIYSRMQIEELIRQWNPTLLCVEHDAAFTESIGADVVELG